MPLGYTPPRPEVTTSVPGGTVSRNATPRSSRNDSLGSELGEGATIPRTAPSALAALTRNSGCDQVIATDIPSLTLSTTPTRPSGATTGLPAITPSVPARREEQGLAIGRKRLVQHFGRDRAQAFPRSELEQGPEPLVLGQNLGQGLRRVALRNHAEPGAPRTAIDWSVPPRLAPAARAPASARYPEAPWPPQSSSVPAARWPRAKGRDNPEGGAGHRGKSGRRSRSGDTASTRC